MTSTNYPNRGKGTRSRNPKPSEIVAARSKAELTQKEAAETVHTTVRVWQQWEAGDRRMHPAFFELFRLKTYQIELHADEAMLESMSPATRPRAR